MSGKSGCRLSWGGLDGKVASMTKKIADRRPLLRDAGEIMISGTARRFEQGVDPEGRPWEISERAMAQGGQTLLDSGRLRSSIDAAEDGQTVYVGSNLAYARIHQLGGEAGRGHKTKLPARAYLGIDAEDREELMDLVARYLRG